MSTTIYIYYCYLCSITVNYCKSIVFLYSPQLVSHCTFIGYWTLNKYYYYYYISPPIGSPWIARASARRSFVLCYPGSVVAVD